MTGQACRAGRRQSPARIRLHVERLEDRLTPANATVAGALPITPTINNIEIEPLIAADQITFSLWLNHVQCVEETTDWGTDDEVYLVVFGANLRTGEWGTFRIWQNGLDSGESFPGAPEDLIGFPNVTKAEDLIFVALMAEYDQDYTPFAPGYARTDIKLEPLVQSNLPPIVAQRQQGYLQGTVSPQWIMSELASEMQKAWNQVKMHDDLMGIVTFTPAPADLATNVVPYVRNVWAVQFGWGDGSGVYWAYFDYGSVNTKSIHLPY